MADVLDTNTEQVKLKLSTMSSKGTIVHCKRLNSLQIRRLFSSKKLAVPTVYTRDFIPANHTSKGLRNWSVDRVRCSQALMPREVVCGEESQPFAQKTDLGWSIVSYGDPGEHYSNAIGASHRIIVKQVMPEVNAMVKLKGEVHYVCNTQVDIIKMLESDFSERGGEETTFSQEDLHFLAKLKDGIRQKQDGHFEIPLPFKQDRPNLPYHKSCAVQRLCPWNESSGETSVTALTTQGL